MGESTVESTRNSNCLTGPGRGCVVSSGIGAEEDSCGDQTGKTGEEKRAANMEDGVLASDVTYTVQEKPPS